MEEHRVYTSTGSPKTAVNPALENHLTPQECILARDLATARHRLEQERIPLSRLVTLFEEFDSRPYNETGDPE